MQSLKRLCLKLLPSIYQPIFTWCMNIHTLSMNLLATYIKILAQDQQKEFIMYSWYQPKSPKWRSCSSNGEPQFASRARCATDSHPLYQESPTPRPWPTTGSWLIRNWAVQVAGWHACTCNSNCTSSRLAGIYAHVHLSHTSSCVSACEPACHSCKSGCHHACHVAQFTSLSAPPQLFYTVAVNTEKVLVTT